MRRQRPARGGVVEEVSPRLFAKEFVMRLVALAVAACAVLACGPAPANFNNPVLKDLQGRWQLTEFDLGGGKL